MKKMFFYKSPVGVLGIGEEFEAISYIYFNDPHLTAELKDQGYVEEITPLIKNAQKQLDEYFGRKRRVFDLPLYPKGTDFQITVWKALQTIPYGETRTYSDIAVQIKNPKSYRAVGMANNSNPIVIVVPCHRVIGKDKSLTGYGGGLETKKYLLDLESGLLPD